MKKSFIVLLFVPMSAFADTIVCHFTEPFITIAYSTKNNTVFYQDAGEPAITDFAVVKFVKNGLEIKTADHEMSLFIDLSKPGNDGMSEHDYAFEAILNKKLYGGCDSKPDKKK
jgi:hypothetical protein